MNHSYKTSHITFVSGHDGTSLIEIAIVVSSAPLGLSLRNALEQHSKALSFPWLRFVVDFCCLVLPVLSCFTVLSDQKEATLTSLALLTILLTLLHKSKNWTETINLKKLWNKPLTGKRPFISAFRANVNLATAICILAVDFSVFPRRFSKAETYGTGLMDVGVGAFVISNALVSPEARGKYMCSRSLKEKLGLLLKSVLSTIPLWILGLVRVLAVKTTDYQEHISEYGVHWNFFFTLACVKLLSSVVFCIIRPSCSWILAIVFGVSYQYLLSGPLHLQHFLLNGSDGLGSRNGFVEANREGLASCLGYLAIYFAGVELGKYIFKPRSVFGDWVKAFVVIIIWDIFFWICLSISQQFIDPVSRRLANFSYILWMMSYNLQLIGSFLLVDLVDVLCSAQKEKECRKNSRFCLLEAINYNGLLYFLIANVLTGLINISVKTIYVPSIKAYGCLASYMIVLNAFVFLLFLKKKCVKFW